MIRLLFTENTLAKNHTEHGQHKVSGVRSAFYFLEWKRIVNFYRVAHKQKNNFKNKQIKK